MAVVRQPVGLTVVKGCDDAPVVSVGWAQHPKPCVTLIYPYYENPRFLRRQLEHWAGLPGELRQRLAAIVVDDGSPAHPASGALAEFLLYRPRPFPIRLFRIGVDVRWNWLAARNVGAHHGRGWLLLTDMDHVVPAETLHAVVHGDHDPGTVYRFSRTEAGGAAIHPHPNSWLMTRDMFWRIGGYDEALSGHYGTDGSYRRRVADAAPVKILADVLVRHEHDGDSSTVTYLRKQPQDRAGKALAKARAKAGAAARVLSFPYGEVLLP